MWNRGCCVRLEGGNCTQVWEQPQAILTQRHLSHWEDAIETITVSNRHPGCCPLKASPNAHILRPRSAHIQHNQYCKFGEILQHISSVQLGHYSRAMKNRRVLLFFFCFVSLIFLFNVWLFLFSFLFLFSLLKFLFFFFSSSHHLSFSQISLDFMLSCK